MSDPFAGPSELERAHRLRADLLLVLITGFWGVMFVTVKDALGQVDALTFLALRFGVGALAMTVVAGKKLFHPGALKGGALLSVFLFLGFVAQTVGLKSTTPSRSAFITGLSVVLVPIVSVVLLRKLPRVTSVFGVLLAVFGLYLLTLGNEREAHQSIGSGDWLTLGCAVAFALHITLNEKLAPGVPVAGMVGVQLWLVAGFSAASLPFVATHVVWTAGLVAAVGVAGVLASAVAISVQTWAQKKTSAVRAALIFSLEPVFASLYSVARGREQLGRPELLGGALIILGVLAAEVGPVLLSKLRRQPAGH